MNNEQLNQLLSKAINKFKKNNVTNKNNLKLKLQKDTKKYLGLSATLEELEKQKDELSKQIADLGLELPELISKRYKYADDIARMENIKKETDKEYKALKSKKENLELEVHSLIFQKDLLEQELSELQDRLINIKSNNQHFINNISLDYIDNIGNGLEFEKIFASLLNQLNYKNVEITAGSGDYGIDVIAEKDEIKYGFQCKLYSSPVGVEAVQEVLAGQKHYGCNLAIVVTNNTFTTQAQQLARESLVALWDRKKLSQIIKNVQKLNGGEK